jgi:hypothetical protein
MHVNVEDLIQGQRFKFPGGGGMFATVETVKVGVCGNASHVDVMCVDAPSCLFTKGEQVEVA